MRILTAIILVSVFLIGGSARGIWSTHAQMENMDGMSNLACLEHCLSASQNTIVPVGVAAAMVAVLFVAVVGFLGAQQSAPRAFFSEAFGKYRLRRELATVLLRC